MQAFTPLLGTLLLSPNSSVGAPARYCVVSLLRRLREADEKEVDLDHFGYGERHLFEQELIQQVVIGMSRLDVSDGLEQPLLQSLESSLPPGGAFQDTEYPNQAHQDSPDNPYFPATIQPSGLSVSAGSLTFGNEPLPFQQLSALPPSSAGSSAVPKPETDSSSSLFSTASSPVRPQSPTSLLFMQSPPLGEPDHGYAQYAETDVSAPWNSPSPGPPGEPLSGASQEPPQELALDAKNGQFGAQPEDNLDDQGDNDQGAVGRLASMSLMAAVTADGKLYASTKTFGILR